MIGGERIWERGIRRSPLTLSQTTATRYSSDIPIKYRLLFSLLHSPFPKKRRRSITGSISPRWPQTPRTKVRIFGTGVTGAAGMTSLTFSEGTPRRSSPTLKQKKSRSAGMTEAKALRCAERRAVCSGINSKRLQVSKAFSGRSRSRLK